MRRYKAVVNAVIDTKRDDYCVCNCPITTDAQMVADALNDVASAGEDEFIQCPGCGWHPVRKHELVHTSEQAFVHIEHYFPKGYDPDKEPFCTIISNYRKNHASEPWVVVHQGQEVGQHSVTIPQAQPSLKHWCAAPEYETILQLICDARNGTPAHASEPCHFCEGLGCKHCEGTGSHEVYSRAAAHAPHVKWHTRVGETFPSPVKDLCKQKQQ